MAALFHHTEGKKKGVRRGDRNKGGNEKIGEKARAIEEKIKK